MPNLLRQKITEAQAVELRAICRHANTRVAALVPWPWAGRKGQHSALFFTHAALFFISQW
uniref:Uncharacterized protein n=1 Tax=Anguilla anguilla TaxID=7936 RepID=A0A0E9SUK3_ANGAN